MEVCEDSSGGSARQNYFLERHWNNIQGGGIKIQISFNKSQIRDLSRITFAGCASHGRI